MKNCMINVTLTWILKKSYLLMTCMCFIQVAQGLVVNIILLNNFS